MANCPNDAVQKAWTQAGEVLGITVLAPFEFAFSGRTHRCCAYLPHFSNKNGILLIDLSPPLDAKDQILSADAAAANYGCSFLTPDRYKKFDRERFVDTLLEWGFIGPEERRPHWWPDSSR